MRVGKWSVESRDCATKVSTCSTNSSANCYSKQDANCIASTAFRAISCANCCATISSANHRCASFSAKQCRTNSVSHQNTSTTASTTANTWRLRDM